VQHVLSTISDKEIAMYTFDKPSLVKEFKQDPDIFYERYMRGRDIVFFDEIQYVKKSGAILKYLYDTYPGIKIIVSGSSAPDIAIQSLKYLVGRVLILEVMPFSLPEFISYKKPDLFRMISEKKDVTIFHKELQTVTDEYMIYGGYPKVVSEVDFKQKEYIIENIYNTLFLREIKDLLGLVENDNFLELLKGIALIQGSEVQYKKLTEITGYSFVTIKKYITLLERMYLCINVSPFFKNKLKEISKSPKIYFLDTGIRNFILNDFRSLTSGTRSDIGSVLEQVTLRSLGAPTKKVYYWRDKSQHEIDFISTGIALVPDIYECKWQDQHISKETINAFLYIHKEYGTVSTVSFVPGKNSIGIWQLQ
jgi:predicted AAA+ superfamily ATPase